MKYFLRGTICISMLSLLGCSDPTEIGTEIQPAGDKPGVMYTDTTTLIAYTMIENPLSSTGASSLLAGSYKDPVFGKSVAGFYTQYALPGSTVVLGDNPSYDSVVVSFAYNGYYGDTSLSQTFSVYELSESMSTDSSYKSNRVIANSGKIGTRTFIPKLKDSVLVDGKKRAPQLRLKLDDTFGNKLFDAFKNSTINSPSDFLNFFRGIYVEPELAPAGEGSVLYFNPFSDQTKITLYYKNDNGPSSVDFRIVSSSVRYNYFQHGDYAGTTSIKPSVAAPQKSDSLVYLHSMGGLKTKIIIPHLENLSSGQIAINQAELIIPVAVDATSDKYRLPKQLFIFKVDSTGAAAFIPDQFEGAAYYGGAYDATARTYKFNIALHLQRILDNKETDYGFFLTTAGAAITADRAVLCGAGKTGGMKLRITYTKLH